MAREVEHRDAVGAKRYPQRHAPRPHHLGPRSCRRENGIDSPRRAEGGGTDGERGVSEADFKEKFASLFNAFEEEQSTLKESSMTKI